MAITVWRIALYSHSWKERLWPLLDAAEQARARRFCNADLQRRYIIAHGGLRLILANIVHQSPETLHLIANPWGKPALSQGGLVFNLSHSQDLALCAVASAGEIGIDIESFRPAYSAERLVIARRFFHPAEYQFLNMITDAAQNAAFLRCWTRKEAYIKAKGLGLSLPLNQFHISCATIPELISSECFPEDVGRYRLGDINVPLGYWASFAYSGTDSDTIIYRDWSPELD